MAKHILKPGVTMTRLEKKRLQKIAVFPRRGRAHYQWRVENRVFAEKHGTVLQEFLDKNDARPVDWSTVSAKPVSQEPFYEKDDGPLTADQLATIEELANVPKDVVWTKSLID